MEAAQTSGDGLDFEDILNQMAHSAETGERPSAGRRMPFGLWRAVSGLGAGSFSVRREAVHNAYGAKAQPADPAAVPSEPPVSIDPAEIARELGLRIGLSAAELKAMRRRFAAANHPDRVAEPLRERANHRMTVANTLIDRAMKAAPQP